MNDYINIMF